MSVPRRILDGGLGKWERQLVRAAADDAPSAEFRRHMARRASLLATTTVASGAAASGAASAVGSGTTQAAGALAWIKLFGIGAIAGVVTSGVYRVASDRAGSSPSGPSVPALAPRVATERHVHASARPFVASPPPPSGAAPAPSIRDVHSGPLTGSSVPAESSAPADSAATTRVADDSALSEELRAIDRVRASLAAGDASGALRGLERYDSASHAGRFRIEADVLRIEALTRIGNMTQARALAATFLSKHPGSPYVRRVSSLVGESR
jgi:hypothetical protein